MSEPLSLDTLSGVSETLLIPLFGRVLEYEAKRPLLKDEGAYALGQKLLPLLARSSSSFHQAIVNKSWPDVVQVTMALRTRHFDDVTRQFIDRHDQAQVVMLGCGLDGRYERLGCPDVDWLNIDLPVVMNLRRQLFESHPRVKELTISALSPGWISELNPDKPTLVLAEGLLMYLPRDQIRSLYRMLAENLHGEFLAEVVAQQSLPLVNHVVLRKSLKLLTDTSFMGGLRHPKEAESWHPKLNWKSTWNYHQAGEPRLGIMNLLKYSPFGSMQWLVLYRLGDQS